MKARKGAFWTQALFLSHTDLFQIKLSNSTLDHTSETRGKGQDFIMSREAPNTSALNSMLHIL